jgi:hypothetical protein
MVGKPLAEPGQPTVVSESRLSGEHPSHPAAAAVLPLRDACGIFKEDEDVLGQPRFCGAVSPQGGVDDRAEQLPGRFSAASNPVIRLDERGAHAVVPDQLLAYYP